MYILIQMPGPPKLYKLSRENQKLFHHKIVSINNQGFIII